MALKTFTTLEFQDVRAAIALYLEAQGFVVQDEPPHTVQADGDGGFSVTVPVTPRTYPFRQTEGLPHRIGEAPVTSQGAGTPVTPTRTTDPDPIVRDRNEPASSVTASLPENVTTPVAPVQNTNWRQVMRYATSMEELGVADPGDFSSEL